MAKHKHKNPRVNVFFRHQSHFFKLFEAINFGSKSSPELKIKELTETYMQIHDNKKRFDGKLHKGQMIRFIDGQHLEFMHNGWIIDHSGDYLLFTEQSIGGPLKPLRSLSPLKGLKSQKTFEGIKRTCSLETTNKSVMV